jgi:hypothetical protein
MKTSLLFFTTVCILSSHINGYSQLGVGTSTPHASAQLDVSSTSKGVLVTKMTQAQRTSITSPAVGLLVYQTDGTAGFYYNAGTEASPSWIRISTVAAIDDLSDGKSGGTNFSGSLLLGHEQTGTISNATDNTGVGIGALRSITTGTGNVALGKSALYSNTTGGVNVAIGVEAMIQNTTGHENSAVGAAALARNTTGRFNNAFGFYALHFNNNDRNNAFGYRSMQNNTGADNSSFGDQALYSTTGNGNIAIGNGSLYGSTSGGLNVAVGYNSGTTNTTGSYNTILGGNANVNAGNLQNATALGYNATVTESNTVQLGNSSVTKINTSGQIVSSAGISTTTGAFTSTLTGGNTASSKISGFSVSYNSISSSTYTLVASDNGKVLTFSAACTVTIPSLYEGFNCMIVQTGSGQITLTADTGVTINNRSSYTKTAGQYAVASIIATSSTNYISGGDMSN